LCQVKKKIGKRLKKLRKIRTNKEHKEALTPIGQLFVEQTIENLGRFL